jgi:hypothetical protein
MAGRPQGAHARTEKVEVRMTPQGIATLDRLRGALSRSAYIRNLLAKEAQK